MAAVKTRATPAVLGALLLLCAGCTHKYYGFSKEEWDALSAHEQRRAKNDYDRSRGRDFHERSEPAQRFQAQAARDMRGPSDLPTTEPIRRQ